jgi:hypothetical protein
VKPVLPSRIAERRGRGCVIGGRGAIPYCTACVELYIDFSECRQGFKEMDPSAWPARLTVQGEV